MRTIQQLLHDAISVIQAERDVLYASNEVDGEIADEDAIETICRYDEWLDEARSRLGLKTEL